VDPSRLHRAARGDECLGGDLAPEDATPRLVEARAAEDVLFDRFEREEVEEARGSCAHVETVHSGGYA
jgi:hypothetical protein